MTQEQNVDVVRRGYELFARKDIPNLLKLFDDSIEWRSPGPADLPTAGVRRGPQQVEKWFKDLNGVFEIERLEPQTFVADGDRVVALGTDTSRVRATGKLLEHESWAHAFTLRNGKVVRFDEYRDTAPVVAELQAAHAHK